MTMPSPRDDHRATTGHEWDGITEYDTPMPSWWLYVFYATIVWSIGYWVVYPAWPGITGYTKGLFGYSSRAELAQVQSEAERARAGWLGRIRALEPRAIAADTELRTLALAGGKAAFGENCAACHGPGGQGGKGYPILADDAWIWGGTFEEILVTLRYGIRSGHDKARASEMPRFGADQLLKPAEIADVAEYVASLHKDAKADAVAAARGKVVFTEQCAACHGDNGRGKTEFGAPDLASGISLYGSDRGSLVQQVRAPRHGVMPAWEGRLDEATLKMLTVYVHSLGGGL
jgi:cytochrome c oxidase cbb3-type subunit III